MAFYFQAGNMLDKMCACAQTHSQIGQICKSLSKVKFRNIVSHFLPTPQHTLPVGQLYELYLVHSVGRFSKFCHYSYENFKDQITLPYI